MQYERRLIQPHSNLPAFSGRYNSIEDQLVVLEVWVFRKAYPTSLGLKSWAEVTRHLLPIGDFDKQILIHNQETAGLSAWDLFDLLSDHQQRHIHQLFWEKQVQDPGNRFLWTLKAVKTSPEGAKTMEIDIIQAILERRPRPGSQMYMVPYVVDPMSYSIHNRHPYETSDPYPTSYPDPIFDRYPTSSRKPRPPPRLISFERLKPQPKPVERPSVPRPGPKQPKTTIVPPRRKQHKNTGGPKLRRPSFWGDPESNSTESLKGMGIFTKAEHPTVNSGVTVSAGPRLDDHISFHSDNGELRQPGSSKSHVSDSSYSRRGTVEEIITRRGTAEPMIESEPKITRQTRPPRKALDIVNVNLGNADYRLENELAKIDTQPELRKSDDNETNGDVQGHVVRTSDDNDLHIPDYLVNNCNKNRGRPQMPPSPTPSMTVDNLLSIWTIHDRDPASGDESNVDAPIYPLDRQNRATRPQITANQETQDHQAIPFSSEDERPKSKANTAHSSRSSLAVDGMD